MVNAAYNESCIITAIKSKVNLPKIGMHKTHISMTVNADFKYSCIVTGNKSKINQAKKLQCTMSYHLYVHKADHTFSHRWFPEVSALAFLT